MQPREGVDHVGRTIDGRYVVESLLGKGGMGVVLRVRHKYTGQRAALKLLHPHLRMQGDLAQRFLAEARAPAAIGHPGIVTVVDAGFTPEGELYLVMELLEGMTLAAAMKPQPMPFAAIRRIGLEILAALGAAHTAGFIHRDLKPENVFLVDPHGTVKLLDFGIAKVLDDSGARGETQTGMVMGTVAYMSPEQLRDSSNVDRRTDLWAAGVMIYEMATGRLPYASESLGNLLVAMMSQAPRPLAESLAEVPPPLEIFLRRALAVDVHQRFTSAAEMAAVLTSMHVQSLRRRGEGAPAAPRPPRPMPAPTPAAPYLPPAAPAAPVAASVAPVVAPVAAVAAPVAPASLVAPPSAIRPLAQAAPSVPPERAATPAPAGASRPSRTATYVALGAILAAVALAVALVFALRGKEPAGASPPVATKTAPDAAATPSAPPDAAPPDAAIPDAAPAKPAPGPKPPRSADAHDVCLASCKTATSKCGVILPQSCASACATQDRPEGTRCLLAAKDDCNALMACAITETCGGAPSGHASCAATSVCLIGCGADAACNCRCLQALAPEKATLFMRFAGCAASRCASDCGTNVALCRACLTSKCASSATACMAQ